MVIRSDEHTLSGQPRLESRRIWVSHVVANVNEMGLNRYCLDYEIPRQEIRDAIEYCMNERCVKSAISFCQGCMKSGEGEECWKTAKRIYNKVFIE